MNKIYSPLEGCLLEHWPEILEHWRNRLDLEEQNSLRQGKDDVRITLEELFYELIGLLGRCDSTPPLCSHGHAPLNVAWHEVKVLLVGEEVFSEVLRTHLKVDEQNWLSLRRQLNRVFHTALRNNSAIACNVCHWTANEAAGESLKGIRQIESVFERLPCCGGQPSEKR